MTDVDPPRDRDDEGDLPAGLRGVFRELKRRRVIRTAAWYIGASAAVLQSVDVFQQALSLPVGTVRVLAIAAVCGLPVAVALSWAYDISADRTGGSAGWARALPVVAVVLVAVVAGGLWVRHDARSRVAPAVESPMPPNRVAILPLDAPDASPEGRAFATYLQERLIEGLSSAASASGASDSSRLRVISRAGTLPFAGGAFTTDSIGRALHAGTLVSGVVEQVGDTVRARLQLIDAASAEVLATRQTEVEASEVLRLVDAVADSLTLMVRKSLGEVVRSRARRLGTGSEAAFQSLLRSEYWQGDFSEALSLRDLDRAERSLAAADSALARAASLDPHWVEPVLKLALLSDLRAQLAQARGERDLTSVYTRGLVHAERALRMAPGDAEAHYARGLIRARIATGGWKQPDADTPILLRGAEEDLRSAAADSDRPAAALQRLSELFASEGRLEESLSYGRRAYVEDPYLENTAPTLLRLFESSLRLDRDDEAAGWCAEGRKRFRDAPFFDDCRLMLMAWSKTEAADPDTAWALMARELDPYTAALRPRLEPRLQGLVAAVLVRAGQPDSARAVLARALQKDPGTGGMQVAAAGVETLLGDRDAALDHVRRALALTPGLRSSLTNAPALRGLRDVPRFRELVSGR